MLNVGTNVFPFRNPRLTGVVTNINGETVTVDWGDNIAEECVNGLGEVVKPFRDIIVKPLKVEYDRYYRARVDWCNWCGRAATHSVTRTSNVSDNTYVDYACEEHAEEWAKS